MMSVAQSLIGIGTMIYPLLVQFLMNEYGFRGGMAILAALNAHSIFGMLVMIPIEWNYKSHKIQSRSIPENFKCHFLTFFYSNSIEF